MMMIVLRLLSLRGLNRGVFSGVGCRWIRGLLARNPCAIGIQPVHTRVDSCGLLPRGDSTKSNFALAGPECPDSVVAAEEIEQGAERLAAIGLQLGVAVDDQSGVVLGGLQQLAMGAEVGQAHVGQAALARAEQLAG